MSKKVKLSELILAIYNQLQNIFNPIYIYCYDMNNVLLIQINTKDIESVSNTFDRHLRNVINISFEKDIIKDFKSCQDFENWARSSLQHSQQSI